MFIPASEGAAIRSALFQYFGTMFPAADALPISRATPVLGQVFQIYNICLPPVLGGALFYQGKIETLRRMSKTPVPSPIVMMYAGLLAGILLIGYLPPEGFSALQWGVAFLVNSVMGGLAGILRRPPNHEITMDVVALVAYAFTFAPVLLIRVAIVLNRKRLDAITSEVDIR